MTALDDLFDRVYADTKSYNAQAHVPKTAIAGSTGYAGPAVDVNGTFVGPNAQQGVNNGKRKSVKERGFVEVQPYEQTEGQPYKPPKLSSLEVSGGGKVKGEINDKGEETQLPNFTKKQATNAAVTLLNADKGGDAAAAGALGDVASGQDKASAPKKKTGSWFGDTLGNLGPGNGAGSEFARELTTPTDKSGHAQNFAQWLVNAANTGLYASAEATNAAAKTWNKEAGSFTKAKDPLSAIGGFAGTVADTVGATTGGLGRGIGEGLFNYRDKRKPLTQGQNLEQLGTKKYLENALGKQHGDFAQGALGTAADIAGDPLTYATLGTGETVKGAISGAKLGADAAEEAARVSAAEAGKAGLSKGAISAARASGRLKGAASGALQGQLKAQAEHADAIPHLVAAVSARNAFNAAGKTAAKNGSQEWNQYLEAVHDLPSGTKEPLSPTVEEARSFAKTGNLPQSVVDKMTKAYAIHETAKAADEAASPVVGEAEDVARAVDTPPSVEAARATPELETAAPETATAEGLAGVPDLATARAAAEQIPNDLIQKGSKLNAGVSTAAIADAAAPAGQVATRKVTQAVGNKVATFLKNATGRVNEGTWDQEIAAFAASDDRVAAALRQPAVYAGKTSTVADLLRQVVLGDSGIAPEQISQALKTGTSRGFYNAQTIRQIFGGQDVKGPFDPDSIATYLNGAEALGKSRSEKIGALNAILKPTGVKRFATVTDAIDAGVKGGLNRNDMRMILNRLGIQTKTRTSSEQLRAMLDGPARTNWAAIQNEMVSPVEAYGAHGISPAEAAGAQAVDVDAAAALGGEDLNNTIKELGYDPTVINPRTTARGGSPVGEAIWEMSSEFGKMTNGGIQRGVNQSPRMVEVYDNSMLVAAHKAAMRVLKNRVNMGKLSGAARADVLDERYLASFRAFDSYTRSLGVIPRVAGKGQAGDPLYVSWSDVYRLLPSEVRKRALFSPERGRDTLEAEAARGFTGGFTAYPNVIMDGVKAAATGADAQTVMHVMEGSWKQVSPSSTSTWADALGAYAQVANEVTKPEFLATVKAMDEAWKPIAVAMSDQSSNAVMKQLRDGIIPLVQRGTLMDRGQFFTQVKGMLTAARRNTTAQVGYDTLTQTQAAARMDSAFINGILGERGAYILNQDERMIAAQGVRSTGGGGMKATKSVGGQLERTTGARIATLDDNDIPLREAAGVDHEGEALDPGNPDPDASLEREQDLADYQINLNGTAGAKRGAFSPRGYVGQEAWSLRTEAKVTGHEASNGYDSILAAWSHGGTPLRSSRKFVGIDQRIADATGLPSKLSADATKAWINTAWKKLAMIPEGASEEEALTRLSAMQLGKDESGFNAVNLPPFTPDESKIALELRHMIDQVFGEGESGYFNRSGMDVKALTAELGRYKDFQANGQWASAMPDASHSLSFQGSLWREIGDETTNKLDMLSRYFRAESASSEIPAIGAAFSRRFADDLHMHPTAEQIQKLGLKRINTQSATGVGRYVDPTQYWSKDEIATMQKLDSLTKQFSHGPGTATGRWTLRVYDAITDVLKPLATIWRPGHWTTNLLGDSLMNMLAGVNPLDYIRAMKSIAARNDIPIDPNSMFASLERLLPEAGKPIDPAKFRDIVWVKTGGTRTPVSLTELYSQAERRGVAMSHSMVADLAGGVHSRVNPTIPQKLRSLTGVPQINHALARGSALRDNLSRMPQFITELERNGGANLEDAFNKASGVVQDYHPTSSNLGAVESQVARRVFYFYTWTRLTASRVVRTAIDHPSLATIPEKAQYEQAQAGGLNPESVGVPFDPDNANIPDYYRTGLLGPTFNAGLSPVENGPYSWGWSPSAPQIDTLESMFEGWNQPPGTTPIAGAAAAVWNGGVKTTLWGNLSPIIKVPAELTFGQQLTIGSPIASDYDQQQDAANVGGDSGRVGRDYAKYLVNNLGGSAAGILKSTGASNQMFPNSYQPKGAAAQQEQSDEANGAQTTALLNWLAGLRLTDYDNPTAAHSASIGK